MANADELVTYLRLTPEFGGTRFGPFEGLEIRLGSNKERCHIVLPEALGVMSEHVRVVRQGPRNLVLAPAERTAAIFLWKPGTRRPTRVHTPTAVQPGDAFSLVTPDGPRFVIELDELPEEIKKQREKARHKTGRRRLSAESMGQELKRQAWTRLLVLGPMQFLQRAWVYIKSGAIYQPRNIIMFLTLASGWIFGSAMMCNRASLKRDLHTSEIKVKSCQDNLAFAQNMNADSSQSGFEDLATRITGSITLGTALQQDDKLRSQVKDKARTILVNAKQFDWLVKKDRQGKPANVFARWRERITDEKDIDPDTARLLVWLAAWPDHLAGEWRDIQDSENAYACGRGPLRMTWRQAVHLGLSAQPDAFYQGSSDAFDDRDFEEKLLTDTVATGNRSLPEGTLEFEPYPIRQGAGYCLTLSGDDDRTKLRRLASTLAHQLGNGGRGLPEAGTQTGVTARLAKYWAADLTRFDFTKRESGLDFSDGTPVGALLDSYESRGQWVLNRTAETIARAITVPCIAVLNGNTDDLKNTFGDDLPQPVPCLVLDWKLRNE